MPNAKKYLKSKNLEKKQPNHDLDKNLYLLLKFNFLLQKKRIK